jgi:hypothetical protein
MASFKYKARVRVESGTEETQFEPLTEDAPRLRSVYVTDPNAFGKYKDGKTYNINPERLEDEAQEELAEEQAAAAKADAVAMRDDDTHAKKARKRKV